MVQRQLNDLKRGITRGDLVFIINTEKPLKTGWYRVVLECEAEKNEIVLVFEKPVHKNFKKTDNSLVHSRMVKGVFLMKKTTLMFDDTSKYKTIAVVSGVDTVLLQNNSYDITSINQYSKNVEVTEDFVKLVEIYKSKNEDKGLVAVSNYMI